MKIHAIQTGTVRIKESQRVGRGPIRAVNVLFDEEWTEPLPILAWAIESEEGVILVDTGETARAIEKGYFPPWHPYFRRSVRVQVAPDEEILPRLRSLGIGPGDVSTVIMTHLHTDHAGGMGGLPKSRFLIHKSEYEKNAGITGRLRGYLPHRWPDGFCPEVFTFDKSEREGAGLFGYRRRVTADGRISIVPTPGHTPHHVSVLVEGDEVDFFLAGDATYTEKSLIDRKVDGVSPVRGQALATMDAILAHGRARPTVYLPTHDPDSIRRLEERAILSSGNEPEDILSGKADPSHTENQRA